MKRAREFAVLAALCAGPVTACESSTASAAPVAERTRVILHIEGMACDSCAARLGKELRDIDGILHVDVVFAEKRATIDYDAKRLSSQSIVAAVRRIGFEATLDRKG